MSSTSEIIAENIVLKNEVQQLRMELQQWTENYDELSMKFHKLSEEKIYAKDLGSLADLKIQHEQFLRMEFDLNVRLSESQKEVDYLRQQNKELLDELDYTTSQLKNYDILKQQYKTLQQASQKQYEELEYLRTQPPKVMVPNPDVTALLNEINRLNMIIIDRCKY